MRVRAAILICAGALALIGAMGTTAGAAAAAETPIPEGAALWFACTTPTFSGPAGLRCPVPYNPEYLQTFLANFTRFTPENEFKMMYTEPTQGKFNFTLADQIAQFAEEYHKTIRGHTLLWSRENPAWLSHPLLPWTASALTKVMQSYIATVVGHFADDYPGVVTEWDVVDEPFNANGSLAMNPWEMAIGPGYIRLALEAAHAANPSADLVLNDVGSGAPGPDSSAMLSMATTLKQDGIPLNTVGFEAHVTPDTAPTLDQLLSLWAEYKAAGLNVEVTELDVNDDNGIDDPAAKQAVFERYAEACRMAGNCTGFTVWGVADQYSWLGPDTDALMFNSLFAPTAAVGVVKDYLDGLIPKIASIGSTRSKHLAPTAAKPAAKKPKDSKPKGSKPKGSKPKKRIKRTPAG